VSGSSAAIRESVSNPEKGAYGNQVTNQAMKNKAGLCAAWVFGAVSDPA
jgi:hypothetical protein